jgi:putative transposase
MSKNSNYNSTNHSKHYLKCHLIFLCKYRKKLLIGQLKDDIKQLLLNITSNSDFEIEVFESDLDHIHFLIGYLPKLSITSIVRKLKQESTYHIWRSPHRNYLYYSILERKDLLVRWLFCLFNWRG